MVKEEDKLNAKEAKARAKAAKAEAKAKKKQAKAGIPPSEEKPWWKKVIQEHLVQIIIKVIAGLIVAYLVWWFGIRK
jgi:hypothetical protein